MIPWVRLENYEGKDNGKGFLLILLDARNRLSSEGYDDDITLSINQKKLNSLDKITQLRLRNEEFFKLNIYTFGGVDSTCMNLFGFVRTSSEIIGIMIINLENIKYTKEY